MIDFSKYNGPMKIIFREESSHAVEITFDNGVGIVTLRLSRRDYDRFKEVMALLA